MSVQIVLKKSKYYPHYINLHQRLLDEDVARNSNRRCGRISRLASFCSNEKLWSVNRHSCIGPHFFGESGGQAYLDFLQKIYHYIWKINFTSKNVINMNILTSRLEEENQSYRQLDYWTFFMGLCKISCLLSTSNNIRTYDV